MPILFMMCGLPGSGKTTLAKQLEISENALRLCPDEWIARFHPNPNHSAEMDRLRTHVESIQWEVAKRVLVLGVNVILENGFWSREERMHYWSEAEALGADVKLCFLDVPLEILWERLSRRNADLPAGTFLIERKDLETWAQWFEAPDASEPHEKYS